MRDIAEEMAILKKIYINFKISQTRVITFDGSNILYAFSYSYMYNLNMVSIFKSINVEKINFIEKESKNNVPEAKKRQTQIFGLVHWAGTSTFF